MFVLTVIAVLSLGIRAATALQLIWDPLANGGTASASSNWNTTAGNTIWYNGTTDIAWSQTGTTTPTQGATFNGPDAAAGAYVVTVDSGQVAVTNLTINNSGYTFAGPNAIYLGANDFLSIAPRKTVTFNCNLAGSGTSPCWTLAAGATMNIAGNLTSGQQVRLAGAATSAFNLTGLANAPAIMFILAPVNLTSGSLVPSSSFYIGYTQTLPAPNSTAYNTGTLTISGSSTVFTVNGNILIIGRAGGTGTLNVTDGTVTVGNLTANRNLAICYDGSAGASGTVNISGGTLNVGSSSMLNNQIDFFQTAANPTATALYNQTGGTVNAWGGIIFGAASGSFSGGSATLIQSGGILHVGHNGITRGANYTVANNNALSITLSGGTVGALANWASALPMTLATTNGNITFQCADNFNNPYTISLSGPLTGAGGLNVAGSGTLALSGANNYAGTTTVSNGTLAIVTGSTPITNGPVTLDASFGLPILTVNISNPGQYWFNNGALAFQYALAAPPALSFQFGALAPSTSIAPVQVNGDVAFTTRPTVTIGGAAIANGTYPLIKYTGVVSGTVPSSASLPGYISSAYITNLAASKTIALVVTGSTYNPAIYWRVGDGLWDINTTSNWTQFGSPAPYADGSAVIFDDSASGTSPITVTLNTIVNPLQVAANNSTKNYVISGTGGIAGSAALSLLGSGTVTLAGTNSYTGGTVLNSGQLNINNGGDPAQGCAIGTGPLTINAGASVDNTSGSNVVIQPNISQTWNGNFTYAGSANELDTGPGTITLNANTTLSVSGANLTVTGSIFDNGNNYQLSKAGVGALTLAGANGFTGGTRLFAGRLNLGSSSAVGSGVFSIFGGAVDNTSGSDLTLSALSYVWSGSFSFLGTANLDLGSAAVSIPNGLGGITLNVVSNTLTTEGDIINNNTTVTKTGAGTWEITGFASGAQSLGLIVSAGQVNLHKLSGQAIQNGNNVGLTVQSGALVLDESNFQIHSLTAIPVPVSLSGGTWDLNGHSENVDKLSLSNGGTLRNGASASSSTLTTISGYTAMLSGLNCQFDVTAPDGILNFNGSLGGEGSLVKIGAGVLNLNSNNTYTGNTTVAVGTLALTYPSLATASTVNVSSNAVLQLNFDATNTVTALVLNGVGQPAGIYSAVSSAPYLAGTGTLQVAPLPSSPTNIFFSLNGNSLILSWPSNYIGWILQTNVAGLGPIGNWHDVPGSEANNQLTFPLSSTGITNEFFRLRYP
jgi:autotransporter-associated beta strand protein